MEKMRAACEEILSYLQEGRVGSRDELEEIKKKVSKKFD